VWERESSRRRKGRGLWILGGVDYPGEETVSGLLLRGGRRGSHEGTAEVPGRGVILGEGHHSKGPLSGEIQWRSHGGGSGVGVSRSPGE